MALTYDKHYKKKDYFCKPYPQLIEYFEGLSKSKYVLDLGCGQGRDSIALGLMGYKVKGVDISNVGINQLNVLAKSLDIDVSGIVNDLYSYPIIGVYDVILLDSILHFYKNDKDKETNLVERILCIFIQKGNQREKVLMNIINKSVFDLEILIEKYIDYPEFNAEYFMYVISKDM